MTAVHAFNVNHLFHHGTPCSGCAVRPAVGDEDGRLEESEAKRVRDDAHRAHAHGRRRNHRIEEETEHGIEDACRDRNTDHIVGKRPEEVLPDVAHDGAGKIHCAHDALGRITHEDDVGARARGIRAAAHCNARIGLGERRRVIDAVAHHGARSVGLKRLHVRGLFGGPHVGDDVLGRNAEPCADGLGRAAVVAREHHDPEAAQRRDGGPRFGPHPVGDGDDADNAPCRSNEERRRALRGLCECERGKRLGHLKAERLHETGVARRHRRARHQAPEAAARNLLELIYILRGQSPRLGLGEHRLRERMLGRLFKRGCDEHHHGFESGHRCRHLRDDGPALGERARLVEDDGLEPGEDLERLGALEENAHACASAHADHDGRGRRQSDRARAGNDEDAHRGVEREL